MFLYLALVLPLILFLYRDALLRFLTPRGIPGVPSYPDPKPLSGDLHYFRESMRTQGGFSKCFDNMARDLGPLSQIRLGFFKTYPPLSLFLVTADISFVVLADVPTIEHVLTKQTRAIDRAAQTTDIFAGLAPTGQIALPTNEMWKHHRRIVGPAMTSKYLSLTTPLANEAVTDVIEYFKAKIARVDGRSWSVEKDMEGATLVSIARDVVG
jgi:cytochrome P450